ncbi:MAG TPA: serine acetyltransferase [Candidatus Scatovivens faecipullorum]|nr:serine acetyltransferase [Candidatus Scatovivens faecipullorum]
MIQSKEDYYYYLECDRKARGFKKKRYFGIRQEIPIYNFQRLMRKTEYYNNCKKGIINKIITLYLKYRYKKLSIRYGFSIPINTFGPGLLIQHRGTICINGNTKIGKNCRINIDVNIGTNMEKEKESPIIGDNCFIGPGVKMFGKIKIGDNVAIGANSVVNRDIENNVTVAGVPAKIVNNKGTVGRFRYYVE